MDGPRESVCRSLFGPVDHDQLRRDLALRLRDLAEQDSRRWNFNFQTETPLAGRFQWGEVAAGGAAAVYQECARPSDRGDGAATDEENRPGVSNTRERPAEATAARRKRAPARPPAKPGSGARITDFFSKRRRTTEGRSPLKPVPASCGDASCKTLR